MANQVTLTEPDVKDLLSSAVKNALSTLDQEGIKEYEEFVASVAPAMSVYAVRAATGDPKAAEMLAHLKGQVEANLWILTINQDSASQNVIRNVILTAVGSATTILESLISKYGLLLLAV